MRLLIACDKFKDALSAEEACRVVAASAGGVADLCPLTDGGDGFAAILTAAVGGTLVRVPVTGPRGKKVTGLLGLVAVASIPPAARDLLGLTGGSSQRLAVIDLASSGGLALLRPDERDPWQTDSRGTGELLRAAASHEVAAIILGLGGSATHDLGLGAVSELGFTPCDQAGGRLAAAPVNWRRFSQLNGAAGTKLPPIRLACDVTNPLLGAAGAVASYAVQKGLRPEDATELERLTAAAVRVLCARFGRDFDGLVRTPGMGAAGGIAVGLSVAFGATIIPGADLVFAWLGLERRLSEADIVVTGEGRFDQTSLAGKGPGAVIARALALGKKVHVFAGAVDPAVRAGVPANLRLHAISPVGLPLEQALKEAPQFLGKAVAAAAAAGW